MLKLPKSLQKPDFEALLLKAQLQLSRPLFESSTLAVPHIEPAQGILDCLGAARRSRHLIGGLEKALLQLKNERHGIERLHQKGQAPMPHSVTRLLLICNGGSERFLRSAERAAREHSPMLAVMRLELDPALCGRNFFGAENPVKAILIDHKHWVDRFFETWLEEFKVND